MSLPPLTFNAWLRHDLVWDILDGLAGVRSVLEIGAGEGAMGARLARRFAYVGLELDHRSFVKAHARIAEPGLGRVLRGDLSALGPDEVFDVVCAFEVLEHIEDDAAALREWRGRLRPEGWLLMSVPAFQRHYGAHDRKAGHYRRYDPDGVGDLLLSGGFAHPLIRTYGFPLGYLLQWTRNAIARLGATRGSEGELTSASGRWLQPPERLAEVTRLVTAPFRLLQRRFVDRRLGTGLVVLARRCG
jgi:SAM-dependent methyltransferase